MKLILRRGQLWAWDGDRPAFAEASVSVPVLIPLCLSTPKIFAFAFPNEVRSVYVYV